MRISIIGSGIVGTSTGIGLSKLGNQVIFYDVDKDRIQSLINSRRRATNQIEEAVGQSDVSFIAVPTPFDGKQMDLSYIRSAVSAVATCLVKKDLYHLVVVKSTVLPNTTQNFIIPQIERISEKKVGSQIGVCVNPEFLTEINDTWTHNTDFSKDFFTEDRVVIGEFDDKSGVILEKVYRNLKVPIIHTDMKTAEMIKFACNCALASRISYWNEIFYICALLSIDSSLVSDVAAMDKRIGKYGTVHGKAFGGKCLPKDLQSLIEFSKRLGHEPLLLKAVLEINERIKDERGVRE